MKIAITGHTRGLGAELKTAYENQGHEVMGFSRRNGFDLRNWDHMITVLDQVQEHDLFVNLAKPDFVQTTILYELWKRWRGLEKIIINIGSGVTYYPTCPANLFDDANMDLYRTAKVSLNEASAQLCFKSQWPHIVMVNPIHLYSNPIKEDERMKLQRWVKTFISITDTVKTNGFNLKVLTF